MNASAFYDVLVIGGGASGLAAAITAARAGKSVCIVERDVACGLKLLATGNGRCNLSNESIDPQRYNHPAFVESVMGLQPEQELMGFFSSLGIMTTSEEGRLYPRSLRRRIGARRASQRLRPPRYHLNLRSQRCLGAQSFRRLGTPNRPSSASAQGKKAR